MCTAGAYKSPWCAFFFFSSRRRHTRFKCDWSSDVCSSDLFAGNQTKESIMAQSMLRALYRGLLYLHPPAFRKRFAEEMLWIFDEAAATRRILGLFADGLVSLRPHRKSPTTLLQTTSGKQEDTDTPVPHSTRLD